MLQDLIFGFKKNFLSFHEVMPSGIDISIFNRTIFEYLSYLSAVREPCFHIYPPASTLQWLLSTLYGFLYPRKKLSKKRGKNRFSIEVTPGLPNE